MKTIKAEYYSKSYYDNMDKVEYRYEIAWNGKPLIHMGDILNGLKEEISVNIYMQTSNDCPPIIPPIIGFTLEFM
jgi:hypothetical protein